MSSPRISAMYPRATRPSPRLWPSLPASVGRPCVKSIWSFSAEKGNGDQACWGKVSTAFLIARKQFSRPDLVSISLAHCDTSTRVLVPPCPTGADFFSAWIYFYSKTLCCNSLVTNVTIFKGFMLQNNTRLRFICNDILLFVLGTTKLQTNNKAQQSNFYQRIPARPCTADKDWYPPKKGFNP